MRPTHDDSGLMPVYIIHWNAPEWLLACVEALRRAGQASEVVVVDNGPIGALPEGIDGVRLLPVGGNRGFSGAANVALADWFQGSDAFCILCSHDVLFEPTTVAQLLTSAEIHPEFGALGPELSDNWLPRVTARYDEIDERRVLSGGCLLLRRSCIEEVGGFDETFSSYGEDQDLSLRIAGAGWRIGTVRDLSVTTLGTRDHAAKQRLDTAATVLLGYKRSGYRGAVRGFGSAALKAGRALRRRHWRESLRYAIGAGLGVRRVVTYRGHSQHVGPQPARD